MRFLGFLFPRFRTDNPSEKGDDPAMRFVPDKPRKRSAGLLPKTDSANTHLPTIVWERGYSSDVAGESHYQDVLSKICGGHNRHGHEFEVLATLVRDPENPYDTNAIAVEISGSRVGFLPKERAPEVAMEMDEERLARVAVPAKVVGGCRRLAHKSVRRRLFWSSFANAELGASEFRNSRLA